MTSQALLQTLAGGCNSVFQPQYKGFLVKRTSQEGV
jgi:hypothetical protein